MDLMEQVVARENMWAALRRVEQNRGAPGVDGMTVEQLRGFLREQWSQVRAQLLAGTYKPQPVRRVEIPKPGGGTRLLGIPTVLDRLIQQALLQVLTPIFDPDFSEHSYGFRPGRSAHQAVEAARRHVEEGYAWVVDLDLEQFFDRVNHDVLMARVMRKVADKRVRMLIRRYLQAGVMVGGVKVRTEEGTPQGGPLSPLLANILLDELDKELERRGHRFVRYADDCNIYVRSERAGHRVMAGVRRFLEKRLRLKINEQKSAVDRPWRRKFLGFSMYRGREGIRLRVAPQTVQRLKDRIRGLTSRTWPVSMPERIRRINAYLRGWLAYFRIADMAVLLRNVEGWLRRRLQACLWKQWKRPRTRLRELRALGHPEWRVRQWALSRRGYWAMAGGPLNSALGKPYWLAQGLLSLTRCYHELRRA
ncbi:Retron-type reverse transcriptase [Thermaerobacter subterraneus DSM 13965]|uniref:RNA-directed DNA polymerase n=2 Tax=Thermaerobacter TaxID=73918 RepID=K6PYH1_9FIRM|nr:Retron-type reverse transcriptase [Thermaerobacter subterraneus DSM 13965]